MGLKMPPKIGRDDIYCYKCNKIHSSKWINCKKQAPIVKKKKIYKKAAPKESEFMRELRLDRVAKEIMCKIRDFLCNNYW